MSGHHRWSEIPHNATTEHQRSTSHAPSRGSNAGPTRRPALSRENGMDHWTNRIASVLVPDSDTDRFLDVFFDRLDGHGVANIEEVGTMKRIEVTIDAQAPVVARLVECIAEAAEASGTDMVFARFTDEYAWAKPM
ncbi:MAG: hypothetical protein ACRDY6_06735 [Acidimicrobiia bacterium]